MPNSSGWPTAEEFLVAYVKHVSLSSTADAGAVLECLRASVVNDTGRPWRPAVTMAGAMSRAFQGGLVAAETAPAKAEWATVRYTPTRQGMVTLRLSEGTIRAERVILPTDKGVQYVLERCQGQAQLEVTGTLWRKDYT